MARPRKDDANDAGRTKARDRARRMKAAGICILCRAKHDSGHWHCPACDAYRRQKAAAQRLADGCKPWSATPEEARARRNAAANARYYRRKVEGKCPTCANLAPQGGHCPDCRLRRKQREASRDWRARQAERKAA